jgi:hypothetical protein
VSEEAPEPESSEPLALAAVGAGFEHRFLFVTVASRRVVQIRAGARPRVDAGSHKPTVVAVAEVLAGFVPYIA